MEISEIFKNKKIQIAVSIIFLICLIVFSSSLRLQNLPLLKDSTTGEYLPLALDPFYFLRLADTIQDNWKLPEFDTMRASGSEIPFVDEILPQTIFLMYKVANMFNDSISLEFITVIYPVIFFALGILAFFFLILKLTNSKLTASTSSFLLAIIPAYLYRTLAGFADHEAIGMFAFFMSFLFYVLSLKFLKKNRNTTKTILYGLLVGLASSFSILSWGGVANFVFLVMPLSFGIIWLMESKKDNKNNLLGYLVFYLIFFISSILFSVLLGYRFKSIITRFVLSGSGIFFPFIFVFLIIDYLLIKKDIKKYRVIYSSIITIAIGTILLTLSGRGIISIIIEVLSRLLNPAGLSRVGITVAENATPYLNTLIGQIGNIFFWIFYAGCLMFGINLSDGIKEKKDKIIFSLLWIGMIFSILFSRISPTSILNGETFLSEVVYFLGIVLFIGYAIFLYSKKEIKIKEELIFTATWLFISLIAVRGAIRYFFVVIPLFCFIVANFITGLSNYIKQNKGDLTKILLWATLILVIIGITISSVSFWDTSNQQAKHTFPSMNVQWQEAMEWTRNNTQPGEVFIHWWDYGYWIQTIGKRPTVTDGGHVYGYWDHLIGRYVLTTPSPKTALSFMKTHNVSYLLIDPSDIGKYPAYGKIGSGEDGEDRYSWVSTFIVNPTYTKETKDSIVKFYQGGDYIDQDIIYKTDNENIFLPKGKAAMIGITLEINNSGAIEELNGIFIYDNKQFKIPIRYFYNENQVIDLGEGINSLVDIVPFVKQNQVGAIEINRAGSIMYFSNKSMNSLFVQKYILNNIDGDYKNIQLVYNGKNNLINSLNAQGANLGDFIYFNGIKGSIKIWKINYPENIETRKEFLNVKGGFGEHDRVF